MSDRHLSCPSCRIRILATASAVDLLEARCPICEGAMGPASSAASVIGFRAFGMDVFAQDLSAPSGLASAGGPGAAPPRDLDARDLRWPL